jgi:hypothetical protein
MNGVIGQHAPGNSGRQSAFDPFGKPRAGRLATGRPGAAADKAVIHQRTADHAPGGVTLRFHIDRVTLPGMSRADTNRVVEAMKKDLAKLANKFPGRNWQALSAIDRLDGGTLRAGARPEQIGEHLAAQIFRRLSP